MKVILLIGVGLAGLKGTSFMNLKNLLQIGFTVRG